MKNNHILFGLVGTMALFASLPSVGAEPKAFRAIVVGVNQYPSTKARPLSGPVGDAEAFAESCRSRGMDVTLLRDSEASKQKVLQAIRSGDPKQNVLVYFSGYGSGPSEPKLLCADTRESEGRLSGALAIGELDDALTALPAKERIVILDACFTGARSSKDGPTDEVVRYYRPHGQGGSREVMLASSYDLPGVNHSKVQYICASRYNEEALEGSVDGKQAGLFTSLLCQTLKAYPNATWQNVQVQVAGKLSLLAADRQHPVFSQACLASRVPEGAITASSSNPVATHPVATNPIVDSTTTQPLGAEAQTLGGPPTTAWDLFAADVRDPMGVQLTVTPDRDAIKVGQPIQLKIKVGKPGYLIVVNHGSEDKVNLLYPLGGAANGSLVKAGDIVEIPGPQMTLSPDRAGQERVKAFLFASMDKCDQFLQSMNSSNGAVFKQAATKLGSRSLVFGFQEEAGRAPILTSDLSIQVMP